MGSLHCRSSYSLSHQIRNLCADNEDNQRYINGFKAQGIASEPALEKLGLKAEVHDGKMKVERLFCVCTNTAFYMTEDIVTVFLSIGVVIRGMDILSLRKQKGSSPYTLHMICSLQVILGCICRVKQLQHEWLFGYFRNLKHTRKGTAVVVGSLLHISIDSMPYVHCSLKSQLNVIEME